MRDIYVLRSLMKPYDIIAIADDLDRASMAMAALPRALQINCVIENHDLLEEDD